MSEQKQQEVGAASGQGIMTERSVFWLGVIVLLLVVASALGVIYSSYKSRQLFSGLEQQKRQAMSLEENWGRLLLEQSTWASHSRIEHLAKSQLDMVIPAPESMVVIKQ